MKKKKILHLEKMPVILPTCVRKAGFISRKLLILLIGAGVVGGFGFDPGQRGGGTTIIINSTAVSGPELIDEMGKYVQENGPLSRQWIGQ